MTRNKKILIIIFIISIFLLIYSLTTAYSKYTVSSYVYAGVANIAPIEGVYAKLYDTDGDGTGETLVLNNYAKFTYSTGTLINNYNNQNASESKTWGADVANIKKVVLLTTIKPTSCRGWFLNCRILEEIENIRYLDTSNCTDIEYMFTRCQKLKSLDVSGFNTSKITALSAVFQQCSSLTSLDLSNWDVSNVTTLTQLFWSCTSLTSLNVSNWDVRKVEDTGATFANCTSLTELDISEWHTTNLKEMILMFNGDTKLKSIYASIFFYTGKVENDYDAYQMFDGCESLVGWNGTTYSQAVSNGGTSDWRKYAHIDVSNYPGLFTIKD